MSWSVAYKGKQADARQRVTDDQHMPQQVKTAVDSMLSVFNPDSDVQLNTSGHVDTEAKTGNAQISISTVS